MWLTATVYKKQNRENIEGCSKCIVRKQIPPVQVRQKDWSQQVVHMQVPNGTGPGVRRSKRPLSACYTRRKRSMETSHKLEKYPVR